MIDGAFIITAHSLNNPETLEENLEIIGSSITGAVYNTPQVYIGFNSGSKSFEKEAKHISNYINQIELPPKTEIKGIDLHGLIVDTLQYLGLTKLSNQFEFNGGINLAVARMVGTNLLETRDNNYVLVLDDGMTVHKDFKKRFEELEPNKTLYYFDELEGVPDGPSRGLTKKGRYLTLKNQKKGDFSKIKSKEKITTREIKAPFVGGRHLIKVEDGYSTEFQIPLNENEDLQMYGKIYRLDGEKMLSANPKRQYLGVNPWKTRAYGKFTAIEYIAKLSKEIIPHNISFPAHITAYSEIIPDLFENWKEDERYFGQHYQRVRGANFKTQQRYTRNYQKFLDNYFEILDTAREKKHRYTQVILERQM